MKPLEFTTFGCKVNTYDTGLLEKRLVDVHEGLGRRVQVINTCAVTDEATREALRTVRRIKAKDPEAFVVVTGCAAQVDTERFVDESAADLIVANSHKGDLANLIRSRVEGRLDERVFKSNIFKKEDLEAGGGLEKDHTRTFLKIQDGCDSFCTFCVIPFARGKSRSIPIVDLLRRVNEVYDMGIREVVLTGVHIGDYRDESVEAGGLEDLVEQVLLQTRMPRIRLSSLEPIELTDRLLELYNDSRLCRHFHMSIQSACSRILTLMKRKYDHLAVENALNVIEKHISGSHVGMDVIVGFPGESEEEFQETYARLESLPWTKMHVFPYSPRPGTFANRLPGHWPRGEIMERARRLRALSHERYDRALRAQVGQVKSVLVLKAPGQGAEALSRDYWPVRMTGVQHLVGMEVSAQVRLGEGAQLWGDLV